MDHSGLRIADGKGQKSHDDDQAHAEQRCDEYADEDWQPEQDPVQSRHNEIGNMNILGLNAESKMTWVTQEEIKRMRRRELESGTLRCMRAFIIVVEFDSARAVSANTHQSVILLRVLFPVHYIRLSDEVRRNQTCGLVQSRGNTSHRLFFLS